ncbi:MAG TPA: helix-turn-helix domain-containing protein, partial [Flavisolibacter sp.]|nr:helix-turn-helix domain-containing protein [Flavisolibacter sp.]
KAEKRMRNLAHMEVKGRIAEALLEIADTFGNNQNGYINITMTRQDIASYAGTTYETVFKFFNDLTNSSIISTSGKSIKIDKPEELRSYIKESA